MGVTPTLSYILIKSTCKRVNNIHEIYVICICHCQVLVWKTSFDADNQANVKTKRKRSNRSVERPTIDDIPPRQSRPPVSENTVSSSLIKEY